ncbi:MAG: hypothetical protein LBO72_04740 [Helicobacteraceae bacterium]|jgi:hypothetical protein|nr:hypothetical protein [Helicobacteraceae bacterium]
MTINQKYIKYAILLTAALYLLSYPFFGDNISCFGANLFRQTKFETKNFIIDLPKFYWTGIEKPPEKTLYFVGVPIEFNEKEVSTMIILEGFNDDKLEAWKKLCDKRFIKRQQIINDWEADVYECETTINNTASIYIVHRDEVFSVYTYNIAEFKRHREIFFENVRLKATRSRINPNVQTPP